MFPNLVLSSEPIESEDSTVEMGVSILTSKSLYEVKVLSWVA
jgi:hypothetical protein